MTGGPHPDLDALADLLAGEGAEADVAHVADCDGCSGRLVELDGAQGPVAAALAAYAAVDVPAPPPDLADRLMAALAAEGAPVRPELHPGTPVRLGDEPERVRTAVPVVPFRPSAPRGRAVLGVAAGLTALLAVTAAGVVGLSGGSDSADTSVASGGTASDEAAGGGDAAMAAPAPAPRSSGTDYRRDPAALTAMLPVLLADDAVLRRNGALDDAAQDTSAALNAPEPAAGAESARAAPGGSAGGTPGGAPAAGASGPDPLARLRDPAALDRCLAALPPAGPGHTPLAVDYASFEGRPAVVLVLPGNRPETVELVAVGPACGADGPDQLYSAQLRRP